MKLLVLLCCATAVVVAYHDKQTMMETNRVMGVEKHQTAALKSGTCDECQSVIKKIVEAAKSPEKLQELKMVLNMLCKETSYEDECRLFVANIDKFIDTLAPYLKDPKAICARIHLCSNKRIDTFHRLLLDYARRAQKVTYGGAKIVCDECEFAVKELKTALENKELQTDVRNFLRENVCKVLGSYRGFCDLIIDEYLPEFVQQADAILSDPHQVCIDVHACDAGLNGQRRQFIYDSRNFEKIELEMENFWKKLTMTNRKGEILEMSCFECQLTVDAMEEEMISKRRDIAGDIQEIACNQIVPTNMTPSCNDFLSIYLPTVIQMTIEQANARKMCQYYKLCPVHFDQTIYKAYTYEELQNNKCQVMKSLEKYMETNLTSSPIQQFVDGHLTGSICSKVFRIFAPICQQFMNVISQSIVEKTIYLATNNKFSQALEC